MKDKSKVLQNALDDVDSLSDDWFGSDSASFDELPSIAAKHNITRTSAYIRKEDLAYLKTISKKSHVSVAQITGDIVSLFVEQSKKLKK